MNTERIIVQGRDGWDAGSVTELWFDLLVSSRFDVSHLIIHVFDPADGRAAHDLSVEARGSTMGLLFDWSSQ